MDGDLAEATGEGYGDLMNGIAKGAWNWKPLTSRYSVEVST
jgi:hypothetical protein